MPYFRESFNIPNANGDALLALSPHVEVQNPLVTYSILHSLEYVQFLIRGCQVHTRYQPMRSTISATIVSTLTCLN